MYEPIVYFSLLVLCCTYALARGNFDAKVVALLCVGGTIATLLSLTPLATRFDNLESSTLIVDLAVLAGFLAVALHSNRFWPLWIAGLQMTTSFSHILKALDLSLFPRAYGAAMAFWSYPILIILAVGTWRGRQRLLHPAGQEPRAA